MNMKSDNDVQVKFISVPKNISESILLHNNLIVMDLNECDSVWSDLLYVS